MCRASRPRGRSRLRRRPICRWTGHRERGHGAGLPLAPVPIAAGRTDHPRPLRRRPRQQLLPLRRRRRHRQACAMRTIWGDASSARGAPTATFARFVARGTQHTPCRPVGPSWTPRGSARLPAPIGARPSDYLAEPGWRRSRGLPPRNPQRGMEAASLMSCPLHLILSQGLHLSPRRI